MQNPDDFDKLKAKDASYHKLELNFCHTKIQTQDWYDLRSSIEANDVVREVHIRITKEFCEQFPLGEIIKLFQAIGSLPKLKYICLGQMQGAVEEFGQIPLQAVTAMLEKGGEKVLWWLMRGMILTHIYKGSEEEAEDKGDLSLSVSTHNKQRKSAKEKKKKEKKSKKDSKKDKKKESKKESKDKDDAVTKTAAALGGMKLTTKQQAAKRCLEKLGDTLVALRSLKRVSLMGHFDETLQGCSLDPLLEGMSALGEAALEILFIAMTRHEGKVGVDPSTLGHFLDNAVMLKECSILYMELTDDHVDEVASGITKSKNLEELLLGGTASSGTDGANDLDAQVSPESMGALFRAASVNKLCLPELKLDDANTVAVAIAMAKYGNLKHVELNCALQGISLLALQQMITVNEGLETLHLHVSALEAASAPLDLVTSLFSNSKSKLSKLILEAKDDNKDAKILRELNVKDWEEIIEGLFKVETSPTMESHVITLTKI